MKRKKKTTTQKQSHKPDSREKLPFIEHLFELRRRLFYIIVSVAIWGGAAYGIQQHIVNVLLKPAHGQKFIYTSPGGGIDFLFRVCLYAGLILSIPVIMYQVLRYIEPLMNRSSARFIRIGSTISGLFALGGIIFGYFLGLPAALHFLLHQFTTQQIQPLVTIQSYMSFVLVYMLGSALMFQVPLIIIFINRIKPLKPQQLFKYERWVIVFAFVIAFIMNPTPNIISQLFVAIPIILSYQVSIAILWWRNRGSHKFAHLRAEDLKIQAERQKRVKDIQISWRQAESFAEASPLAITEFVVAESQALEAREKAQDVTVPVSDQVQKAHQMPKVDPAPIAIPMQSGRPMTQRPRKYINDFIPRNHRTP